MTIVCNILSIWAIPITLLTIVLIAWIRGVPIYETFVEGAGEGFQTAIRIMPFLVAMMVAISVFRDSGALNFVLQAFSPILQLFGIPEELVPLGLMRPLSGTGALGIATEIMQNFGPDSFLGRTASAMVGSTDTTFYILTVYFGAVGISRIRYALYVGLVGDIASFLLSIYICRLIFGQ